MIDTLSRGGYRARGGGDGVLPCGSCFRSKDCCNYLQVGEFLLHFRLLYDIFVSLE